MQNLGWNNGSKIADISVDFIFTNKKAERALIGGLGGFDMRI